MRLFIYATSTDSINFLAAISGATIKCLVAFGRRTSNIINVYRTVALKHTTVIIRSIGLDEIGLCTSTRWSPGTWQLLLMFHLDRVNRLPEQTQRRVYGCALLVLRRVGAKKFFAGRVSPNKASETQPTRLNIRPTCSNHDTYINVPPPPTQYRHAILYDTYIIYTLAESPR